jgi:hypothetical protein
MDPPDSLMSAFPSEADTWLAFSMSALCPRADVIRVAQEARKVMELNYQRNRVLAQYFATTGAVPQSNL